MFEEDRDELDPGASPGEPSPELPEEGEPDTQEGEPPEQEPEPEKPGAVPYDRFAEQNAELREMRETNRRLTELLTRQAAPQPQAQEEEDIVDPETAIKKLRQENAVLKQGMGQIADQIDLDRAERLPGWSKMAQRVEETRRQLFQQGRGVFTRADVFHYLKGLDGGQPQASRQPAQPQAPQAIPRTKATAPTGARRGNPRTLDEEEKALSNITF